MTTGQLVLAVGQRQEAPGDVDESAGERERVGLGVVRDVELVRRVRHRRMGDEPAPDLAHVADERRHPARAPRCARPRSPPPGRARAPSAPRSARGAIRRSSSPAASMAISPRQHCRRVIGGARRSSSLARDAAVNRAPRQGSHAFAVHDQKGGYTPCARRIGQRSHCPGRSRDAKDGSEDSLDSFAHPQWRKP